MSDARRAGQPPKDAESARHMSYSARIEKCSQDSEVAISLPRQRMYKHRYILAFSLAVAGALWYGNSYWGCHQLTGCHAYALQSVAAMYTVLFVALKVNPWLWRYTACIQADDTLRILSRVLTAAYVLLPFFVLAIDSLDLNEGSELQFVAASFTSKLKYIYNAHGMALFQSLVIPYWFAGK